MQGGGQVGVVSKARGPRSVYRRGEVMACDGFVSASQPGYKSVNGDL